MQSIKILISTSTLTTCNLQKLTKINLHKLTLSFKMINTSYLWYCGNDLLDFIQVELEEIGGNLERFCCFS